MSFIFEWIYNGFSSVLQFLGKAISLKYTFQMLCISQNNLNIGRFCCVGANYAIIIFFFRTLQEIWKTCILGFGQCRQNHSSTHAQR